MNIIETENLTVRYQGTEALSDLSIKINAGDYIGVIGPNGSGKTTFIKALLGLVPYEGKVLFYGQDMAVFNLWCKIGYLPQKALFFDPHFPAAAEEIIGLGLLCDKEISGKEYSSRIKEIAEILKITELLNKPIGKLSGGQQQRVLLARALVHRPEILLLDEPTIALDPQSREVFYSILGELNKGKNITIFLVSHDVGTIGEYVSKLMYLDRKMIFYGRLDEFCGSREMTGYFGNSSQHIICHRHI